MAIGPSTISWNGKWLEFDLDEITVPLPSRIKGKVRVHPSYISDQSFHLDQSGNHSWWPIAPRSQVEVEFSKPRIKWSNNGYFDSNWGNEPLESTFMGWHWSCARRKKHEQVLSYNTQNIDGLNTQLYLHFDPSGEITHLRPPPSTKLPNTKIWRMPRFSASDSDNPPIVKRTLEDTPFYSRSLLMAAEGNKDYPIMHESLDLRRFTSPWTQLMLPFRMPRNILWHN